MVATTFKMRGSITVTEFFSSAKQSVLRADNRALRTHAPAQIQRADNLSLRQINQAHQPAGRAGLPDAGISKKGTNTR